MAGHSHFRIHMGVVGKAQRNTHGRYPEVRVGILTPSRIQMPCHLTARILPPLPGTHGCSSVPPAVTTAPGSLQVAIAECLRRQQRDVEADEIQQEAVDMYQVLLYYTGCTN